MRRKLSVLLLSTALSSSLAVPFAAPASASIPGCADSDYQCGYLHGFADGRTAKANGLCARRMDLAIRELTPSEQGYQNAFEHFCPA